MFATIPVYNLINESEERIIQTDHIEEIKPADDVPVDPGAVVTPACTIRFHSGTSIVVLLPFGTMKAHLKALTGVITEYGELS